MRNRVVAFVLTLSVMMFCFIDVDYSFALDTTKPELNSFKLVGSSQVDANGSIEFEFEVVEEDSGIRSITMQFNGEVETDRFVVQKWFEDDEVPFSGTHSATANLNNDMKNGKYKITFISLEDIDGNVIEYDISDLVQMGIESEIVITNSTFTPGDQIGPIVKSVDVKRKDSVDAKGTLTLEVTMIENESGVDSIGIWFEGKNGHVYEVAHHFPQRPLFTGKHTIKVPLKNKIPNGEVTITSIEFRDKGCNSYFYACDEKINVHNSTGDLIPPTIKSIEFEENNVRLPNVVKLNIDVEEEDSSLFLIDMTLENENGHTMGLYYAYPYYKKGNMRTGKHTIRIPVNPFKGEGTYRIKSLSVSDAANNNTYYDENEINTICQNNELHLSSSYDVAYRAALGNLDKVMECVDNMKPGEVTVVDCRVGKRIVPKRLFEKIAGQNKKVVFENETMQWIFDGKRIKKADCKDVDLHTSIEVREGIYYGFPDEEEIAYIIFADNGRLPGDAEVRINHELIETEYAVSTENLVLSYEGGGFPVVEDDSVEIEKDYAAVAEITHNSAFALSRYKPKSTKITSLRLGKTKYVYSGKECRPYTIVFAGTISIPDDGYYSESYSNNKKVGTATVKIKGKGIFVGTKTKHFTIVPKGTKLKKATGIKKGIVLSWKKQKVQTTGYEIKCGTKKSLKKAKTIIIKRNNVTKKEIKKLKSNRVYYVKVRTYKRVKGKKYYSSWSKSKKKKTK